MTPGAMLRTIRTLQEMTQKELADASGVSQPAISAMESGRVDLGPDRARKLAAALRVHPAILLFPDLEASAFAAAAPRKAAAKRPAIGTRPVARIAPSRKSA